MVLVNPRNAWDELKEHEIFSGAAAQIPLAAQIPAACRQVSLAGCVTKPYFTKSCSAGGCPPHNLGVLREGAGRELYRGPRRTLSISLCPQSHHTPYRDRTDAPMWDRTPGQDEDLLTAPHITALPSSHPLPAWGIAARSHSHGSHTNTARIAGQQHHNSTATALGTHGRGAARPQSTAIAFPHPTSTAGQRIAPC